MVSDFSATKETRCKSFSPEIGSSQPFHRGTVPEKIFWESEFLGDQAQPWHLWEELGRSTGDGGDICTIIGHSSRYRELGYPASYTYGTPSKIAPGVSCRDLFPMNASSDIIKAMNEQRRFGEQLAHELRVIYAHRPEVFLSRSEREQFIGKGYRKLSECKLNRYWSGVSFNLAMCF